MLIKFVVNINKIFNTRHIHKNYLARFEIVLWTIVCVLFQYFTKYHVYNLFTITFDWKFNSIKLIHSYFFTIDVVYLRCTDCLKKYRIDRKRRLSHGIPKLALRNCFIVAIILHHTRVCMSRKTRFFIRKFSALKKYYYKNSIRTLNSNYKTPNWRLDELIYFLFHISIASYLYYFF